MNYRDLIKLVFVIEIMYQIKVIIMVEQIAVKEMELIMIGNLKVVDVRMVSGMQIGVAQVIKKVEDILRIHKNII
jgi:hypothetical protein